MKRIALASLLCLACLSPLHAEEGYEDLFNGKDLTGWEGPKNFSVQDGAITGVTDAAENKISYNQFLIWKGGNVDNFELKCDFRLEGSNNSGVQYRSKKLEKEWSVGGYQADIHTSATYTGMLYDEQGRGIVSRRGQKVILKNEGRPETSPLSDAQPAPIDLKQWHELTITAEGNHIVHKIDKEVVVDITDENEKEREMEGIIALQIHAGAPMKAQFKNIRLKKLPKTAAAAAPAAAPPKVESTIPKAPAAN